VQSASDVSSSLAPRIAEISADVYGLIVREIPQLRGDKRDLARSTDNASIVSAAGLRIADITSAYIDKVSEEMLSACEAGKENWLRNLSVARGARVQALLRGERADVDASEAILGYRLRQHHLGVVCWIADAAPGGSALGALEQATAEMTRQAGLDGRPIFLPQDESSAWAWLPLGAREAFPSVCAVGAESGIRFALGSAGSGVSGFRRTHQQALGAHTVALAAGRSGRAMTSFADVAPLAQMAGSTELIRAWVIETLGALADDNSHHATLRETLSVFLQENGSFVAAAERLTLHKNSVRYRVGKAEESLGHPVGEDRLHVELALLATQWLGPAVLRQAAPSRL
jgi:DNA-binding PucR family transcriptional regulator